MQDKTSIKPTEESYNSEQWRLGAATEMDVHPRAHPKIYQVLHYTVHITKLRSAVEMEPEGLSVRSDCPGNT